MLEAEGQKEPQQGTQTGAMADVHWERRLLAEIAGWGPVGTPNATLARELVSRELDPARMQIVLVTADPARLLALLGANGSRTLRVVRDAPPAEEG